jgi:hypothetical protein
MPDWKTIVRNRNYPDAMILYVRSMGDPQQVMMPVRREIGTAGPQILIGGTRTGREIPDGGLFQARMGVRMALGAAQASVLRLILKQGMSLVLTGVLIGFAAALLVGRLLSRMLCGVSASDPISVAGAALVLSAVALLACYLPARWASRVDALVALREGDLA